MAKDKDREARLAAIRARLEEADTGGSGGGTNWMQLKEGINKIRILPEVGEMEFGSFFQKVGIHYLPGNERAYCSSFTTSGEEDCPICDVGDELYRSGKKTLAGKLLVSKRYWMNVIDRNDEDAGPKRLDIGVSIMQAIASAMMDPDYGDITNPEDGMDVTIERNGTGMDTKYQVRFSPRPSRLSDDPDLVAQWLEDAADLSVVVLSNDPEEDGELTKGATLWVKPYERVAEEWGTDRLMALLNGKDAPANGASADDDDDEADEHPVQRSVRRRARRRS